MKQKALRSIIAHRAPIRENTASPPGSLLRQLCFAMYDLTHVPTYYNPPTATALTSSYREDKDLRKRMGRWVGTLVHASKTNWKENRSSLGSRVEKTPQLKDFSKRVEINNEVAGCAQDFLDAVSAIGWGADRTRSLAIIRKRTLVQYVMYTVSKSLVSQPVKPAWR